MAKIVSCDFIGEQETVDLEVDHKDHQFYLANGLLTSNSHAIAYAMISYQCAWLLNYYPHEWLASFLDHEDSMEKAEAVSLVKSFGYEVSAPDINYSDREWEISPDGKLLQPLTYIKGMGKKALQEVMRHRPYTKVEDILLNPDIDGRRLNKKHFEVLTKAGALDSLLAPRFENRKHLHLTAADRPDTIEALATTIESHRGCGPFTDAEEIENQSELTGIYPMLQAAGQGTIDRLRNMGIPRHSDFDESTPSLFWGVVTAVMLKKTRNGKPYAVFTIIDDSFSASSVKIWGWNENDEIANPPHYAYMFEGKRDSFGLSCRHAGKIRRLPRKHRKNGGA